MKKLILIVLGVFYLCSLAYSASNEAGGDYAIPSVMYGKEDGELGIKAINTDSTGKVYVILQENIVTRLIHGIRSVTVAGTALGLTVESVPVRFVEIRAGATNMGYIFVGNASLSKVNGYQLTPNAKLRWRINNLRDVYIDANVAKDQVSFIAEPYSD